jgi:serine/threonine-protein kinase
VVTGEKLGRYTLLGKLATGGMAEVFLARQDGPQGFAKTVVIKKILPHLTDDAQFVQMFLNEARLAALINHPNVVSIYELGEDPESGTYYMVMEYIDGCNLKRVAHAAAKNRKSMPVALSAKIVADSCAGLDFAHNLRGENSKPLNIVHRDVSPENILLTYGGQVKVVDFGIAKASHQEGKTKTGQLKGKFGYMAPEQTLGKQIDRRADVWALGVVLYWMCTGAKPFSGDSEGAIIQQILYATPPPPSQRNSHVDAEIDRIVLTALAKDPEQRYASARALQLDLERWAGDTGNTVSSLALAEFMAAQFPEATDSDRLLTRAILSGDFKSSLTPSQTDFTRSKGSRSQPNQPSRTNTEDIHFEDVGPRPRKDRPILIGLGAGAMLVTGGLMSFLAFGRGAPKPMPVAVPMPIATAPVPAPQPQMVPAPPAEPPVVAAPSAVPTPTVTPRPTPPSVAPPSGSAPVANAHAAAHHHTRTHADSASPPPPIVEAPDPPPPPRADGPPGRLAVRVLPWATVFVDGQLAGTTPFEPISVPSGRHSIRLVNDEIHAEKTLTVEVRPGETAMLKAKLE